MFAELCYFNVLPFKILHGCAKGSWKCLEWTGVRSSFPIYWRLWTYTRIFLRGFFTRLIRKTNAWWWGRNRWPRLYSYCSFTFPILQSDCTWIWLKLVSNCHRFLSSKLRHELSHFSLALQLHSACFAHLIDKGIFRGKGCAHNHVTFRESQEPPIDEQIDF